MADEADKPPADVPGEDPVLKDEIGAPDGSAEGPAAQSTDRDWLLDPPGPDVAAPPDAGLDDLEPLATAPEAAQPRDPPPRAAITPPAPERPRRRGLFRRLVFALLFLVFVAPVLAVGLYRFAPPPATALMIIRATEGKGWDYRWRPLSRISPTLVQALVAAEDARFCEHGGFDMKAIEQAMRNNKRRPGRVRGGSTISQQTAKNVFLWPARSYVRKGMEAYFTILIEALWGKRRIMEVYLNVAEWGPGVYGAEAASRRWFGKSAASLSRSEAARLAAILPSPLKWKAAAPGPYVRKRSRRIGAATGTVRSDGLAACVAR